MRTVKLIQSEAKEALLKYEAHQKNCVLCNKNFDSEEEKIECQTKTMYYEDYQFLIFEEDFAERLYQAEKKERK